ncbi:uncharacterized protein [Spinacia oleracea]|uniref:Neprosin PEP catalytic domain-containing protein n=1 Tax=Spinacia oleracea TaxID=3562 RepID=A0A9R0HR71_SPIOL|nr:uncharacterized protein LOC110774680 [Spinacia oleracea]
MVSPSLFLVIFSSLVLYGLCDTSFSNQQDVKTIKTEYGTYDCVDFYKQPAFNHPLLKNHSSKAISNLLELQGRKVSGIGLPESCPVGTVPILRTNQNSSVNVQQLSPPQTHCVALVHTNKLNRKFNGVGGAIGMYKPVVQTSDQRSSARIKLSNGNDSLEAGWMVNPKIFNDYEAHLYQSFDAGGKGCINLQCPGFVQVTTTVPLGTIPSEYTKIGGNDIRAWNLSIDKHQDDGNWWLSVTYDKEPIGYWPKQLFTSLADVAGKVEWGGEVYDFGPSSKKHPPPPEMGNGFRATKDLSKSASIFHASYVDESFTNVINPEDTHEITDCDPTYTVLDGGWVSKNFGRVIYYGGYSILK